MASLITASYRARSPAPSRIRQPTSTSAVERPVRGTTSLAADDVRIADHALTQSQIQTDMVTPLGGTTPPPSDTTAPNVSLTPPPTIVSGTVNLTATASDNVSVAGV